mmetsp:Transcript_40623/g.106740  ORF Transcript_40623/g.106740 Transcript_40623/m.106740 type:complete len:701 (-) Transcript_40623:112-2214(-)
MGRRRSSSSRRRPSRRRSRSRGRRSRSSRRRSSRRRSRSRSLRGRRRSPSPLRRSRGRGRSLSPSPPRKAASPPRRRPAPEPEIDPSVAPGHTDRLPPVDLSQYAPEGPNTGWHVHKQTGKWRFHPETGLFYHAKTDVYYRKKEEAEKLRGMHKRPLCEFFQKGNCIYGDLCRNDHVKEVEEPQAQQDAHSDFVLVDPERDVDIFRKLRNCEEVRKAVSTTDFVKWEATGGQKGYGQETQQQRSAEVGPNGALIGRVLSFDPEKGFGFIVPLHSNVDSEEEDPGVFVHRKHVVGSTPVNPINLREGARVEYRIGTQDGRTCCLDVMMLGADMKPLGLHCTAGTETAKKKAFFVQSSQIGVRVHGESWPGLKKLMEDRTVIDEHLEELGVMFALFDGHGGPQVSEQAQKVLHKSILAQYRKMGVQPASRDAKLVAAVKAAFAQADKEICEHAERKNFVQAGCCAAVVILHGNPRLKVPLRMVVAHLGDTRAVMCRAGDAVCLSEPHTPDRLEEKKRVEKAGGLLLQVRGAWRLAAPVSGGKFQRREYQALSTTRSLGDLSFKSPTVLSIADPDVTVHKINDKDMFLILCSDGVFPLISDQEAVDLALKEWENPEDAAKRIVRAAFQKGSEDNMTAVVIQFGWTDKHAPTWAKHRLTKSAWEAKKREHDELNSPVATAKLADIVANQKRTKAVEADDFDMFG